MNAWETSALQEHSFASSSFHDPQATLFYSQLYAPSQYNIMEILAGVHARPNPRVELGYVDTSCSFVLCDLGKEGHPIVYASPAFYEMTGYTFDEIRGKNCRFLQSPGNKPSRRHIDKDVNKRMRKTLERQSEVQVEVVNFKKNGERFVNILTLIPVMVSGRPHCVGFQYEKP